MLIKVPISYKNWLLLNRGEIRPEIGDKVKIVGYFYTLKQGDFYKSEDKWIITPKVLLSFYIEDCYVEIDYNPNESIEFAEWIAQYQYERDKDGLWRYWDNGIGEHTTKELFNLFKKEQNERQTI